MKHHIILMFSLSLLVTACQPSGNKQQNPAEQDSSQVAPPHAAPASGTPAPADQRSVAIAFYNDGYRAFQRGDYSKAVALYQQSIAADPSYTDAYDNCGLCYRRLGLLDSAKSCYRRSIALRPELITAHMNLGVVYMAQQQPDSALIQYREIIKYDPAEPESYYGIADVYLQTSKPDSALKYALEAVGRYKASKDRQQFAADAEYYVGLAYYQKGNKEQAKAYMSKALLKGAQVPEKFQAELNLKKLH